MRTSTTAVEAILGSHYDGTISLSPFVETASALVDQVSTCAASAGSTLNSTLLELIERWLAAHLYALADQIAQSKATGNASASFQGTTGLGIDGTQYGQTARILDISGCLAKYDRGEKVIGIEWLGKEYSDQLDWEDRN